MMKRSVFSKSTVCPHVLPHADDDDDDDDDDDGGVSFTGISEACRKRWHSKFV